MALPTHLKILEGEFPEYQKLLDNTEVEPTTITLPGLPNFGPAQADSGKNKRTRSNEGEMENTGAFGGGTITATVFTAIANESLMLQDPTGLGTPVPAEEISRDDGITTLIGSPLLPEPSQLMQDHILTLLAVAIEGRHQDGCHETLGAGALPGGVGDDLGDMGTPHLSPARPPTSQWYFGK
jgi:hypothetical protein